MVRKTAAAALTALGLLALPAPAVAATPSAATPPAAPGELIVLFEDGVSAGERAAARDRAGADFERGLGLPGAQVVAVDGSLDAAATRLERQPAVRHAVPNLTVSARAQAPNDPLFPRLWGLTNVGALGAWDLTRGAGQTIAVVDTGVDLVHPDLAANLWSNPGELPNGLDDDGNGRVDDLHGWDVADGDGDPSDEHDHGTHVAGIAAAVAGNGVGVAGVAPQARVMAVRVLDADGYGPMTDAISGVLYAAQEGASVINLSLGAQADPGDAAGLTALWNDTAAQAAARGALLVVAAGNDASDNDTWPDFPCSATAPTIVCVAALGTDGRFDASYSNRGARSVDLAAPGSAILSTTRPHEVLLRERFDGPGFAPGWSPGGWSIQPAGISELGNAAADSVGSYAVGSNNVLYGSTQVAPGTHRSCLLNYLVRHRLAPGDQLWIDVVTAEETIEVETVTDGDGSAYFGAERDLSEIPAGPLGVRFTVVDDGALPTGDGVYVDDVEIVCRGTVHVAGGTD
ncbi:MAG TPA: S8 family serine peptidase, partial [Conexibacter sp.]|nr:S8 family serine peptidase [Conexibacter sp.]